MNASAEDPATAVSVAVPNRRHLDVRVTGGLVRGVREGSIFAWRGIPYAAPPINELRFRAPRPVVPWHDVRDASRYSKVAPQIYRGQFKGTSPKVPSGEDCLSINVIAAAISGGKRIGKKPVMVFIHGGGYSVGSSQDFSGQGTGLVSSGRVVYVSFNYRLGALGYLDFSRYSTPDRPIESNLGLRDQVAALEWVRDNIRAFGGDPGNVTLFGESAGGNAVTTLMTTPAAAGLFARAIAQSAPPNAVYSKELSARWAEEFVGLLQAGGGSRSLTPAAAVNAAPPVLSVQEASDLLMGADVGHLNATALELQMRVPDEYPGTFCLAPVVDGDFLPERPIDAFRFGRAHRVPLILGTNDREGSAFRGRVEILPSSLPRIDALFDQAPESSHANMHQAYPGLPSPRPAADFAGDSAFWFPSVKVADLHSRFAPVHMYRFDVAPRLMRMLGYDATHGIEMLALFDRSNTSAGRTMTVLGGRTPFMRAGERMRGHWLQFVSEGATEATWPDYDEATRLTLVISETDRVESDPRGNRRRAWEAFLPGF
ncbi:carboxylesterase/lipase family protein [Leifsonia sp. A12D58]|uniref:carboxylesterase/lipase family protein n=1 Tax=Leifsonia sp. A12D58 TaxID=3397674 RepID=UPI0039E0AA5E